MGVDLPLWEVDLPLGELGVAAEALADLETCLDTVAPSGCESEGVWPH
jgi:hypothetical protein